MESFRVSIKTALILLMAFGVATALAPHWAIAESQEVFHIQAHRGAGINQPENTLEAFEYSWSIGVTPEADLRVTRDGVIVCFHDANLARVVSNPPSDGDRIGVENLTLKEVKSLEVGSFRGNEFDGQRIPTLAQVFEQMQDRPERLLYLDIKKMAELDPLVSLIEDHGVGKQVIFTTTHHRLIRDWKQHVPDSLTLLWNGGSETALREKLAEVRDADFDGITHLQIHVRVDDLESEDPFRPSSDFLREIDRELHSRGIVFQTLPWEGADKRAYTKLLELGTDSFATDYPEVTIEAVEEFRAHRNTRTAAPR